MSSQNGEYEFKQMGCTSATITVNALLMIQSFLHFNNNCAVGSNNGGTKEYCTVRDDASSSSI